MREQYSEDFFAETRMSFGEHLEDLRGYLWRAVIGLFVGITLSIYPLSGWILQSIKGPVERALATYHVEYYKENQGERWLLLEKILESLQDPKEADKLQRLVTPRKLPVLIPRAELDQALRESYPDLFKNTPPIAENSPPVQLGLQLKPLDLLIGLQDALVLAAKRTTLTTLSAQEMFMVYIQIALLMGLVIASPYVFHQLWSFVAAGLYPHEKKLIHYYLPLSVFLFLSGVLICQFFIIPAALDALLSFNMWLKVEPDFRLNEWLSFAIWMPVITGLCFQLPLVMLFLGRLGIFTPAQYAGKRRIAYFVMCIFAAVVSPSIDPWSLAMLWVPMCLLYELGIWLVKMNQREPKMDDIEVPYDPDAPVPTDGEPSPPREEGEVKD